MNSTYVASKNRYENMCYNHCGKSGLKLPAISLGCWHNFGGITPLECQQKILRQAFDLGITHFDLADNYGPPYGSAEDNFGYHMKKDWLTHRDELVISTKAGYEMWEGPYGDNGTKKHLIASLDNSLKKMNLDYVDIFYHHRPDPDTPLEETVEALARIVQSGKALYIGISNYNDSAVADKMFSLLHEYKVPVIAHQFRYSMLAREAEITNFSVMKKNGIGGLAFAPLHSGVLTGKYINGIPKDSRAIRDPRYLKPEDITSLEIAKTRKLSMLAEKRGQTLSQMALAWVLRDPIICSAIIGASKPEQVRENVAALQNKEFTEEEIINIQSILDEKVSKTV